MKQLLVVLALAFAASVPASATTCNKYAPIFIANGSDTPVPIPGTSGKLTRVCSIVIYGGGGGSVSFLLVESSTTGCGCGSAICTGAAGVIGGSANAGQGINAPLPYSLGTGNINAVASTATTGNHLCLYSGANSQQLGGLIIYTQETP